MFSTVNKAFASWLQKELTGRGWTQAELSRRSKVSTAMISSIVTGAREVGMDTALSFADALDLPHIEVLRIAGIIPEDTQDDQTLERIRYLYGTLKNEENKKRALEFLQFLKDLEDKNRRG